MRPLGPIRDSRLRPELKDLRSQGGGSRRSLEWDALDASALPQRSRELVGETWRERMRQEHLAVGAFALLAQELARVGCDPIVLSLVARASADEVRHTEVCRRMAETLLGEAAVPHRYKGLPHVPPHEAASPEDRVLLHVVEMCCLSETLTAVYFTEMVARATHPVARAVVESLLEDEIDHSRAGWAYLASRARERTTDGLAPALPALLDRTVGRALVDLDGRVDEDDPAMEAFGYLGGRTGARILRQSFRDVILRGFEELGIDDSAAQAWGRERGYLESTALEDGTARKLT